MEFDQQIPEDVNNEKLSAEKYESIHFLLATLGLDYL